MIRKLPAGTRIYLTKKYHHPLYIRPDHTLGNDTLYVAYDVRSNGVTVIPRGTRVKGDWVTESRPVPVAQLQLTRIFLNPVGQEISADSEVIEDLSGYNRGEVDNVSHLYKINQYRSTSNLIRRIVDVNYYVKTLLDEDINTPYLEIYTKEIPVTLTEDFMPLLFDSSSTESSVSSTSSTISLRTSHYKKNRTHKSSSTCKKCRNV